MQILLLNGPNLNMLGHREPELYGRTSLSELEASVTERAKAYGVEVRCVQSNHEGVLIDAIGDARLDCSGIIINPAGYGHTSVALRDALLVAELPVVEVHLTNLAKREAFRHKTLITEISIGLIAGFGVHGYHLALEALLFQLNSSGDQDV